MSRETLIRTICLALALVNQVLVIFGISPLPIEDSQVEVIVSTAATVIVAIVAWWKNNSFTKAAIVADDFMHQLKDRDGDME